MKKKKIMNIIISVLVCIAVLIAAVPTAVYLVRGSYKGYEPSQDFYDSLKENAFENESDVRIMSSNLLVHYESWGGWPAKPRAAEYTALINEYKPDVIGIQELCDSWYCLLKNNMPDGYKMLYPVTTGAFVRMTAMVYNADRLTLVDSGNFAYEQGDNPRLRRVVWAVFEVKETAKRFAVTNTHFDLLRDGREQELTAVMESQAQELSDLISSLSSDYSCPVFAVGDFNTMEDTPETKPIDIPAIYNTLAERFTDAKFSSSVSVCGTQQTWEYPLYDHIFIDGNARADCFALLSYDYLSDMSDHYPIFTDASIS